MAKPKQSDLPEGFTPSRPLPDERRERFCQLIVRGKGQSESYEAAGFKPSSANASTLRKNAMVSARIEWLLAEAAKVTVYDRAAIQDRMALHAWNLTETIVDEMGKRTPGPMFNASAGARALELLGREHGLFKEKIELGGTMRVENTELFRRMTPEERGQLRAALMAAQARLPPPANQNQADDAEPEEPAGLIPHGR